jgi:hypothetical protein
VAKNGKVKLVNLRQSKKRQSNLKIGASGLISNLISRSNSNLNSNLKPNLDHTPSNLEIVLSKFANGNNLNQGLQIPDYSGFRAWVHAQLLESNENSFVFNRLHRNNEGHIALSVDLIDDIRRLKDRYKSLLKTNFNSNTEYILNYNKYKLLLSVFSEDKRSVDFFDALDNLSKRDQSQEVDLDLCTQAELRIRFFDSLRVRNWRQTFLILGKLNKLEHDPGEVAYFTSLAYFESDDFSESIKYASHVQTDHPDYIGAAALWLESLAFLGDIKAFAKKLKVVGSKQLSPMYLRYLLQIIMTNANDPSDVPNLMETEMGGVSLELAEVDVKHDPFFPAFNRHSCEIAVRLAEYLGIKDLESSLISDGDEHVAEHEEEISPELLRLGVPLCSFDRQLWEEILDAESHERFIPIVKRLLNVPYPVTLNDHIQALKVQLRLGGALPFIQNTARMLDSLANQNYDAKLFIEIVQAAFIQATVLSSDLESKFKEFLLSVSGNVLFPDTHRADIARLQLLSTLSPMGRQSYEWAETALNAAEENSKGTIRDAGMISLGFFRIFELELNSRILIPLRKDLKVVDLLDANWQLVQKQLEDLKTTETKNKIKSIEKCIKFWSRLVPELKKVLSGESSGLELGSLEYLLSKTSNIDGPDQEFKEFLVSLLSQRFTEIGLAAHRSGALSELINGTVRERFRNPPAHTRFLPLRVARECKAYVDTGLQSLSKWLC